MIIFSSISAIHKIVLAVVVMAGGYWDIRERRIPNWVSVSGVVIGFAVNGFMFGAAGLLTALKGLGLAFLVYFPLYLLRAMGAGDVKLMGAVGAILGPVNWLGAFALSVVIGAFLGVISLLSKGRMLAAMRNIGHIFHELGHLRAPYVRQEQLDITNKGATTLPHGAAIALGSLLFVALLEIYG